MLRAAADASILLHPCLAHPRRFAKGVLSGVVPWPQARRFFAWRLKRRLTEEGLIRHISSTDVSISRLDAISMVSRRGPVTRLSAAGSRGRMLCYAVGLCG
jgi:hypothetical protein